MNNIKKSALIMGFGSIGEKHAMILNKYFNYKNIFIFTKRKIKKFKVIKRLKDIKKLNFNYIIISSDTSKHFSQLNYILKNFRNKKILIEKPLFTKFQKIKNKSNKIYVGFNLRFHPQILFLKKFLNKKKIYNVKVTCNSFLPNWRKNIDYKKSSSSNKSKGGGVILDLSHEFDYIRWIFGEIKLNYVKQIKLAKITNNTEDTLNLHGKVKNANLSVDLNYISRIPKRTIFIDAKDFSITLDLILNYLTIKSNKRSFTKQIKNFDKNLTYINQHRAILSNKKQNLCSLKFANETMRLIDKIKKW